MKRREFLTLAAAIPFIGMLQTQAKGETAMAEMVIKTDAHEIARELIIAAEQGFLTGTITMTPTHLPGDIDAHNWIIGVELTDGQE